MIHIACLYIYQTDILLTSEIDQKNHDFIKKYLASWKEELSLAEISHLLDHLIAQFEYLKIFACQSPTNKALLAREAEIASELNEQKRTEKIIDLWMQRCCILKMLIRNYNVWGNTYLKAYKKSIAT